MLFAEHERLPPGELTLGVFEPGDHTQARYLAQARQAPAELLTSSTWPWRAATSG